MADTIPTVHLHLGHDQRTTGSGGTRDHIHPVTGEVLARIPLAGPAEVEEAVAKAAAAQEAWRNFAPEARRDMLFRLADLVEAKTAEFARMAALDGGTPLIQGERGVGIAVAWTRYYAGWCDKLTGELMSTFQTRGEFSYNVPEPIGIVGIINTWNGPLIGLGMKVAPALAAGNCVICKPAEITPFAPELFAQCAKEAGIPDGVLSNLPGAGEAGGATAQNPRGGRRADQAERDGTGRQIGQPDVPRLRRAKGVRTGDLLDHRHPVGSGLRPAHPPVGA